MRRYLLKTNNQVSCESKWQPHESSPWVITGISPPASVPSPFAELNEARLQWVISGGGKEGKDGEERDLLDPLSQFRLSAPDADIPEEVA